MSIDKNYLLRRKQPSNAKTGNEKFEAERIGPAEKAARKN